MDDLIVSDGPEDVCFGCGQRNDHGLRMTFRRTGDASVEATYTVPSHYNGPIGVVHGGIQAVLLDEAMGMAVHVNDDDPDVDIVTAEFGLRYRRPVPTETELTIRGTVTRVEDANYFVEGQICDASGEVLTRAEARWRRLDRS